MHERRRVERRLTLVSEMGEQLARHPFALGAKLLVDELEWHRLYTADGDELGEARASGRAAR